MNYFLDSFSKWKLILPILGIQVLFLYLLEQFKIDNLKIINPVLLVGIVISLSAFIVKVFGFTVAVITKTISKFHTQHSKKFDGICRIASFDNTMQASLFILLLIVGGFYFQNSENSFLAKRDSATLTSPTKQLEDTSAMQQWK